MWSKVGFFHRKRHSLDLNISIHLLPDSFSSTQVHSASWLLGISNEFCYFENGLSILCSRGCSDNYWMGYDINEVVLNISLNIERKWSYSFISLVTISSLQGAYLKYRHFLTVLFTLIFIFFSFFTIPFQSNKRFFVLCPSSFVFMMNSISPLFWLIFLFHFLIKANFEVFFMVFKF